METRSERRLRTRRKGERGEYSERSHRDSGDPEMLKVSAWNIRTGASLVIPAGLLCRAKSWNKLRSLIKIFYQQVVENSSPSPAPFPKYGEGEALILQSPLSMLGEGVGGEEKRGIVQIQCLSFPEGPYSCEA